MLGIETDGSLDLLPVFVLYILKFSINDIIIYNILMYSIYQQNFNSDQILR